MAGRPRSENKAPRLTLSVTPQIREYLARLVERGLYGKTQTQVGENMLTRGIESVIERGHLTHPPTRKRRAAG